MSLATTRKSEAREKESAVQDERGVRAYSWTVDEFYRAIGAGALRHPERLELIDGEILQRMSPQQTPHVQAIGLTSVALDRAFGPANHVRTQTPLDVSSKSEPEPDVIVVRGEWRDYDDHKPRPSDVLVLVEVSDATLRYDRGRKAGVYARAGIQDYWVVDVKARRVIVYRAPQAAEYADVQEYGEGETIAPLAAPGAQVAVGDLLPRADTQKDSSALLGSR